MSKKNLLFLAVAALFASTALANNMTYRVETEFAKEATAFPQFYTTLLRATEVLVLKQSHIKINFFKSNSGNIKFINNTPFEVIFEDVSLPKVSIKSDDTFTIPCNELLANSGIHVLEGNDLIYTAETVLCGDVVYIYNAEDM